MSSSPKEIGTLVAVLLFARNLPDKGRLSKQSPYCLITVNQNTQRTKTIDRGGQKPEWDEEFRFPIFESAAGGVAANVHGEGYRNVNGNRLMRICCYADDSFRPRLIGEVEIDLTEALRKGEVDGWFTLQKNNKYSGEVYLEMTFWSNAEPPAKREVAAPIAQRPDSLAGFFGPRGGNERRGEGSHSAKKEIAAPNAQRPDPLAGFFGPRGGDEQRSEEPPTFDPGPQVIRIGSPIGRVSQGPPTYPTPQVIRVGSSTERVYAGPPTYPSPEVVRVGSPIGRVYEGPLRYPSPGVIRVGSPTGITPGSIDPAPPQIVWVGEPGAVGEGRKKKSPAFLDEPQVIRVTSPKPVERGERGEGPPRLPTPPIILATTPSRTGGDVLSQLPLELSKELPRLPDVGRAPQNPVIGSVLSSSEVIALLVDRGCMNLSSQLDPQTCSEYPVSNGGFGDIYSGKLRNGAKIAIKTVRPHGADSLPLGKYQKRSAKELYTWSKCNHPNVTKLLGLAEFRGRLAMISAWVENGNLPSYLRNNPSTNRCSMSAAICEGLVYLHENDIVHGDLKGANVLISDNGAPMLTDFGNASLDKPTVSFTETTTTSFSLRWTAPEIINESGSHSRASDVYALAMTILETFTGQVPFHDVKELLIPTTVLDKKKIPPRPDQIPVGSAGGDILWPLLMSCWIHKPGSRPNAAQVRNIMRILTPEALLRAEAGHDD